jgi:hypothetical protein
MNKKKRKYYIIVQKNETTYVIHRCVRLDKDTLVYDNKILFGNSEYKYIEIQDCIIHRRIRSCFVYIKKHFNFTNLTVIKALDTSSFFFKDLEKEIKPIKNRNKGL